MSHHHILRCLRHLLVSKLVLLLRFVELWLWNNHYLFVFEGLWKNDHWSNSYFHSFTVIFLHTGLLLCVQLFQMHPSRRLLKLRYYDYNKLLCGPVRTYIAGLKNPLKQSTHLPLITGVIFSVNSTGLRDVRRGEMIQSFAASQHISQW